MLFQKGQRTRPMQKEKSHAIPQNRFKENYEKEYLSGQLKTKNGGRMAISAARLRVGKLKRNIKTSCPTEGGSFSAIAQLVWLWEFSYMKLSEDEKRRPNGRQRVSSSPTEGRSVAPIAREAN